MFILLLVLSLILSPCVAYSQEALPTDENLNEKTPKCLEKCFKKFLEDPEKLWKCVEDCLFPRELASNTLSQVLEY